MQQATLLDKRFRPHHVSLSVADMQRSIDFYSLFGFEVSHSYASITGDKRISHLKLANLILELFELRPVGTPASREGESNRSIQPIGIRHFALETGSIESAHQLATDLALQCEQIMTGLSGMRYFFVSDPDGIWFEIVEDKRQP